MLKPKPLKHFSLIILTILTNNHLNQPIHAYDCGPYDQPGITCTPETKPNITPAAPPEPAVPPADPTPVPTTPVAPAPVETPTSPPTKPTPPKKIPKPKPKPRPRPRPKYKQPKHYSPTPVTINPFMPDAKPLFIRNLIDDQPIFVTPPLISGAETDQEWQNYRGQIIPTIPPTTGGIGSAIGITTALIPPLISGLLFGSSLVPPGLSSGGIIASSATIPAFAFGSITALLSVSPLLTLGATFSPSLGLTYAEIASLAPITAGSITSFAAATIPGWPMSPSATGVGTNIGTVAGMAIGTALTFIIGTLHVTNDPPRANKKTTQPPRLSTSHKTKPPSPKKHYKKTIPPKNKKLAFKQMKLYNHQLISELNLKIGNLQWELFK